MKIAWTTSEMKEKVLTIYALVWAVILLLPGNSFANPSRIDVLSVYAPDTVWGILLLFVTFPMFRRDVAAHGRYRKFAHAFYWVFWSGIFLLAVFRSAANGFHSTDLLISLPFLAIAILHAVIYAGLGRKL